MGYLSLEGRTIVVTGVANKHSVAWHVHQGLVAAGARPIHVVRDEATRDALAGRLEGYPVHVCNVEQPEEIEALAAALEVEAPEIHGLVHSIAFANFSAGLRPFHETERADFLQALDISCFSLVALSRALAPRFAPGASVVTLSISHTHQAAESYGYMAPIKAALDSAVVFLAKSFSPSARKDIADGSGAPHQVRFNAVKAGPLKTSSSAGIPGYLDNYLYAEQATLRHAALRTQEVADTVLFLLSPRSSGINAQGLTVDAGMGANFFDREIVRRVTAAPAEEGGP